MYDYIYVANSLCKSLLKRKSCMWLSLSSTTEVYLGLGVSCVSGFSSLRTIILFSQDLTMASPCAWGSHVGRGPSSSCSILAHISSSWRSMGTETAFQGRDSGCLWVYAGKTRLIYPTFGTAIGSSNIANMYCRTGESRPSNFSCSMFNLTRVGVVG